ncbi:hypothetical protein BASA50_005801 [Batrachochytrium salamandrivorans]|uniref:non-specific serine/threonine protein kinase n=1 Tax=Batrachochytrium salamandrivorans TaxID=1357716 RepID=A0ABQ8FBR2_9FUNG|nr:hypothetical protein BASA50_005801 [Batrachochytrium salamandrivorans]KAH9269603.1 hypothetical protein BASA83_008252 [Batrachochytrium salamandrivorans]
MPLPVRAGGSKATSYSHDQDADQYNAFTKMEAEYFISEYLFGRVLGKGFHGVISLATRKSDGKKVAYKSIPKSNVYRYALESIPPPRCHLRNPLVPSEKPSVVQCMSPRPPNLPFPYEFALQTYLSRPGYENPYVPRALDYIILKDKYILVMDYLGEDWVNLAKYVEKKGPLDIETARDIIREIVNGMIYLKQYGILHGDLDGMSQWAIL